MDIPAFEDLFKEIKINLCLFGIPFYGSRIQLRFYFMLIAIILMVIGEGWFIVSRYAPENLLELTQLAPCLCQGLLSVLKIIPIAAKRQKLFELIKCLNELYNSILINSQKKKLVQREMILVKILMKYFFILNAVLISVYNFSTLLFMFYSYIVRSEIEFILPYDVVVPFSTESWATWFVAYIYSITCGFVCVFYFTTVDALYCVLTSHICKNFAIISNEIQGINATNENNLKDLVKNHQYVLKLSEDLEEIFRLPNLFNVLVGSLEICALGFNLTMGPLTEIPKCILFLTSVLLQMLLMSVFGENLIRESRKVGEAAFCSKWYDMDKKSKKTILIIITRCQKHQKLTAYKFSVISYGSFTKIISTSWSYFTILKTVYKPSE